MPKLDRKYFFSPFLWEFSDKNIFCMEVSENNAEFCKKKKFPILSQPFFQKGFGVILAKPSVWLFELNLL